MEEVDELIKGLYESNMSGKLSDRQYHRIMAQYDEEQERLEKRIAELQAAVESRYAEGAEYEPLSDPCKEVSERHGADRYHAL